MTAPKTYRIQIDVEVRDLEALFDEAYEHWALFDMSEKLAAELLRPDGELDVAACIRTILDPREMHAGIKGLSCLSEELPS